MNNKRYTYREGDYLNINNDDVKVVFIADYTLKSFNANGITIDDLARYNNDIAENKIPESFGNKILSMSKYDVGDYIVANIELPMHLFSIYEYDTPLLDFFYGYAYGSKIKDINTFFKSEERVEHLNKLLNDLKYTNSNVFIDDNKRCIHDTFSLEIRENTIFVILHNGFSDFIVNSDTSELGLFVKMLVGKMFEVFGEKATLRHSFYSYYVKNIMNNNVKK